MDMSVGKLQEVVKEGTAGLQPSMGLQKSYTQLSTWTTTAIPHLSWINVKKVLGIIISFCKYSTYLFRRWGFFFNWSIINIQYCVSTRKWVSYIILDYILNGACLGVGSLVKNPPAMQETWIWSLGWEDPLEEKWQPTPVFWPRKSHGQRSLSSLTVHGVGHKSQTWLSD